MPERMGMNKQDTKDLVFLMNKKQEMLGYTKKEQKQLNLRAMKQERFADIVRNAYHMLEKFTLMDLYTKLDATPEQLGKFEELMNLILQAHHDGIINVADLKDVCNQHLFIEDYVAEIPYRVKMMISRAKPPKNTDEALILRNCVNGAFGAWFGMALFAAHKVGFEWEQLSILMDGVMNDIDSYGKGFLQNKDIDVTLEVLEEETGYKARASEGMKFREE